MENESLNKINEIIESIPDRDFGFEMPKTKELYDKYVSRLVKKIEKLKNEKDFVSDNSFNGVKASHHIMYKCKVNDKGETLLLTPDGHIGYEFLVEFDLVDTGYGIYYGCRGHIKEGDQKEGIERIETYWEMIKGEVCAVLNNTFVEKDFLNRFQKTNNANNKTFWPFWIALGADEDIIKVAARATKLIRNVYKKYIKCIDGDERQHRSMDDVKEKTILLRTNYTEEAYEDILAKIREKNGAEKSKLFHTFIMKMEKEGIIKEDDRYERCWRFEKLRNVEVHCLIRIACEEMGLVVVKNRMNNGDRDIKSYPWEYFTPVFLSIHDENFNSIRKTAYNTATEIEMKEFLIHHKLID